MVMNGRAKCPLAVMGRLGSSGMRKHDRCVTPPPRPQQPPRVGLHTAYLVQNTQLLQALMSVN